MHAIYLVQFTRILASAVLSIHSNVVSFRITVDWRTFIDNIMPTYKLVFGERLGFSEDIFVVDAFQNRVYVNWVTSPNN